MIIGALLGIGDDVAGGVISIGMWEIYKLSKENKNEIGS
jgi:hypothetical protein